MSDIFFQYQDFSKSRYPGFFQNTFFARRVLSFLWLPGFFKKFSATGNSRYWRNFTSTFLPVSGLFQKNPYSFQVESRYLVPEIQNTFFARRVLSFLWLPGFFKKFSATGKSRYWRNFTSTFLPVSRCKTPMGFITYGSLSQKSYRDSGTRFLKNLVPEIISKPVFCPSPQSGFLLGRALLLLPRLAPARWPLYGQQCLHCSPPRRLRVVLGAYSHRPLFPFPLCSHFYSSSQHETTHFLSFAFLVEFCPRNI